MRAENFFFIFIALAAVAIGSTFLIFSGVDTTRYNAVLQGLKAMTISSPSEYSWNQKMTLIVETDDGAYEGSSIVKVTWRQNPRQINDASWLPDVEGQAPSVVLDDGTRLFGLLGRGGYSRVPAWIAFERDGSFAVTEDMLESIAAAPSGTRFENPYNGYPHLVGFENPNMKVSVFLAKDRFSIQSKELIVEKTDQPVPPESITRQVPWLLKTRDELIADTGGVPKAAKYTVDGGQTFEAVSKHDLLKPKDH